MHSSGAVHYGRAMRFPDSTFAALRISVDDADESHSWPRVLLLALVLTVAAVSAGLLAGG
jgi:hypothetical protein